MISIMEDPKGEKTNSNPKQGTDDGKLPYLSTPEHRVLKSKDSIKSLTPQNSKIPLDDSKNFVINILKNHRITICKPLIPLKLTLFLYYGAGSFMTSFITVLYKQRGVSLSQLSTMTMISPVIQFLGTALSGIAADKLGRAKPVFVVNLLITLSVVIGIMLLPKLNSTSTDIRLINLTCHQSNENEVKALTSCGSTEESIEVESCYGYCHDEFIDQCSAKRINCGNFDRSNDLNMSFIIHINNTFLQKNNHSCEYHVTSILRGNSSYSWCLNNHFKYCALSCTGYSIINLVESEVTVIAYFVLFILFLTTYSNCYRCLDVTVMFLVKEHNSTFGHERFFAMLGNVLISPIAGYIADVTTPPGGEKNYNSALYLSISMNIILLPILYKLQVRVKAPGEKMWKKSLILLTNPDALSFFILIFVLGTAWNFGKYFLFWYLEGMHASSVLIGLITSVSALYGLPFLLSSHWWVKKIGSTRIFILALLGYAVNSIGYSFLQNPWLSLVLEGTGVITYYVLWVAVMEYSHDIAPEGLTATIIAISGALHFSVGKVSSGLMGKFIMNHFGGQAAFRFGAVMTLSAAFVYAFYLFVRDRCTKASHKLSQPEELNKDLKMEGIYMVKMRDEK